MTTNLGKAIAECLALHAEALQKFGTETPEENSVVPVGLQSKMRQARANVATTLEGETPELHAQHVAALNHGLRVVIRRLSGGA